jgi:hypothetical protein
MKKASGATGEVDLVAGIHAAENERDEAMNGEGAGDSDDE